MLAARSSRVGLGLTPTDSLVERFGLFTIIVLGEVVLGVVAGLSAAERDAKTVITGLLALWLGFGFWWIYFDLVGRRLPRTDGGALSSWVMSHLPITGSITAAGAGMVSLIAHAHDPRTPAGTSWLLAGAVAAGLLALVLTEQALVDAERLSRCSAARSRPGRRAVAALVVGWAGRRPGCWCCCWWRSSPRSGPSPSAASCAPTPGASRSLVATCRRHGLAGDRRGHPVAVAAGILHAQRVGQEHEQRVVRELIPDDARLVGTCQPQQLGADRTMATEASQDAGTSPGTTPGRPAGPDQRYEFARSSRDLLRLVGGLILLLVGLVLATVLRDALLGFETDLTRAVRGMPEGLAVIVLGAIRALSLLAALGLVAWLAWRRQWMLLGRLLLAGVVAAALLALVDRLIGHAPPPWPRRHRHGRPTSPRAWAPGTWPSRWRSTWSPGRC